MAYRQCVFFIFFYFADKFDFLLAIPSKKNIMPVVQTDVAHLSCDVPLPAINLLADVRYNEHRYFVKECLPRKDIIGAVVSHATSARTGRTVLSARIKAERCCFKDYVYVLWRVDPAENKGVMVTVEEHELDVLHNEPTLECAIEWIKDGPNDPTKGCRLVPVRNTNTQHNHHTLLVHMMSLHLLENHAHDGAEHSRKLLDMWEENCIDAIYFPHRPEVVDCVADAPVALSDTNPEKVE